MPQLNGPLLFCVATSLKIKVCVTKRSLRIFLLELSSDGARGAFNPNAIKTCPNLKNNFPIFWRRAIKKKKRESHTIASLQHFDQAVHHVWLIVLSPQYSGSVITSGHMSQAVLHKDGGGGALPAQIHLVLGWYTWVPRCRSSRRSLWAVQWRGLDDNDHDKDATPQGHPTFSHMTDKNACLLVHCLKIFCDVHLFFPEWQSYQMFCDRSTDRWQPWILDPDSTEKGFGQG